MTVLKSPHEVAAGFMLQQGRHFCENSYCDCIERLAELVQWERSNGATIERERIAAVPMPALAKAQRFSSREPSSRVRKAI